MIWNGVTVLILSFSSQVVALTSEGKFDSKVTKKKTAKDECEKEILSYFYFPLICLFTSMNLSFQYCCGLVVNFNGRYNLNRKR